MEFQELVMVIIAIVITLVCFSHERKCRHSLALVKRAEERDQDALHELIRLDLEGLSGVVLLVESSWHYEYHRVISPSGDVNLLRSRLPLFPSQPFLAFYVSELRKLQADQVRARHVIDRVEVCMTLRD